MPVHFIVVRMRVSLLHACEEHLAMPRFARIVEHAIADLRHKHLNEVGFENLGRHQAAWTIVVKTRGGLDAATRGNDHRLPRPVFRVDSLLFEDRCGWRGGRRAPMCTRGKQDGNKSGEYNVARGTEECPTVHLG